MRFVLFFTVLVDVDYNTVFFVVGWLSLGYIFIMYYYWFKNWEYLFSFDGVKGSTRLYMILFRGK